ncbi:MAG TPA: lysophospholipid acyltransferase family protein [Saprospiraceae bacterium]|nr:lysophospholipid acyltransferase family protein [Saprospiraceae bacterium]
MNIIYRIRGICRLCNLFVFTLYYLILTVRGVRSGISIAEGLEIRRKWSEGFVKRLGFRIEWEGSFSEDETYLFVGNHRCSLDPQVVMAKIKAFPVSRAEVRNWPLVGKGSAATGIIFVDKSSKESRSQVKSILLDEMRKGNSVLIFPEGQTNINPTTTTFQKGSFEQAATGGFSVVPFVIEYKDTRDYWDHTDSFAVHLIKRFGKPVTHVKVVFGPSLASENAWTLLRSSQKWIDDKIMEVREKWDSSAQV